jgi:hypothetical protein
MLTEKQVSGIISRKQQQVGITLTTTEEETVKNEKKSGKTAQEAKELEVDDKMVVAAAADINKVLAPNPLLDLEKPGEELQKEVEELFPNIVAGDKLAAKTWDILKALGWKPADTAADEKAAAPAKQSPLQKLAAELNTTLVPDPLFDLADECLEGQVVKLMAEVKSCDPLSDAAWTTLKKLGWKDKDKKKAPKTSAAVHPITAAAAPQTYTMLKMPADGPRQMVQIVECLKKGPLAGDRLLSAMAKVIKTRQPLASILRFYQKRLIADGYVKVS